MSFQCVIVAWVYGADRLMGNLGEMGVRQGGALRWYWTVCWRFVCPAVLAVLVGSTLYEMVTCHVQLSNSADPAKKGWCNTEIDQFWTWQRTPSYLNFTDALTTLRADLVLIQNAKRRPWTT